ncbi:MAG TPA: hypothetical protein VGP26_14605 [Actinophytocola sp.]|jgi:hypothetical protein|nr:hypothetical protein [Actinophytocola sp.]
MIAEDLAPLIAQFAKPGDLGFHAGKVLAWNKTTGENTVDVAGTALQDLPMLNLGDTVNLAADDTVAVLRYKSTMFIVGRIVPPGSESLASGAVLPATGNLATDTYAITTTKTLVLSTTLTAPPWSDAVTVSVTMQGTGRNNRGVADRMFLCGVINGSDGPEQFGQGDASPNPSFAYTSASYTASGLLPGGTSFDVGGKVRSLGGTWTADVLNQCNLLYSVMYFKV